MVMLNSGGNWLKASDVTTGDKVIIKDEGSWQENTKYKYPDGNPKMDFVITVTHKGADKLMRLNQTNRTTLMEAFGRDTALWINKVVQAEKMMALVGPKQVEVIILRVNKGAVEPKNEMDIDTDVSPEEVPF